MMQSPANRKHVMSLMNIDATDKFYPDPEAGEVLTIGVTTGQGWNARAVATSGIFDGEAFDVLIHEVVLNRVTAGSVTLLLYEGANSSRVVGGCTCNTNTGGRILGPMRVSGGFSVGLTITTATDCHMTVTYEIVPKRGE